LSNLQKTLLHSLDNVLRPLDKEDGPYRKEPASTKKLKKGDVAWGTRKIVLGWIIHTILMTLELPQHCKDRLLAILAKIPRSQKCTYVRRWQQILGELRLLSIALPGSQGLLSLLQEALRHQSKNCIQLSQEIHAALNVFRWLAQDISQRPTRIYKIVPQPKPELLGAQDTSGAGMGGVWFPASNTLHPRLPHDSAAKSSVVPGLNLWPATFPNEISKTLVSHKNLKGQITNSDLELAAGVIQHDILARNFDVWVKPLRVDPTTPQLLHGKQRDPPPQQQPQPISSVASGHSPALPPVQLFFFLCARKAQCNGR
jgi:hypothetical protein